MKQMFNDHIIVTIISSELAAKVWHSYTEVAHAAGGRGSWRGAAGAAAKGHARPRQRRRRAGPHRWCRAAVGGTEPGNDSCGHGGLGAWQHGDRVETRDGGRPRSREMGR